MDTFSLINRAHQGDKLARDKILMENTGLIWSVVKRFLNRGYEREDLFQIGCIGMLKAIDRFDDRFQVAFSTYAVPVIMGEIRRFIRDDGLIKVSRIIKENQMKIVGFMEKYSKEKGMEPTINEIEKELELSREEIVLALDAMGQVESIDREIAGEDNNCKIIDFIEDNIDVEEHVINKIYVGQLLEKLNGKERKLINLRYFQNKTQLQVAQELEMTQVQVSRLEKKILLSMKKMNNM